MIKLGCKWLSDVVEIVMFLFICGLFYHINAQNVQIHELTQAKNNKVHELNLKLEKTNQLAEARLKMIKRLETSLDAMQKLEQEQSERLDFLNAKYEDKDQTEARLLKENNQTLQNLSAFIKNRCTVRKKN